MTSRRGFSLLEVVIAMAILGLSLMAVFDLNSGAISSHTYTKKLTVASLLARSKMTDLEQELYDKGFNSDDDEESGDFSQEGWPSFKWRARILAPKTQGLNPQQLLGAVFNLPMGGGGEGAEGGGMGPLGALFGGGAVAGAAQGDPSAGAGAAMAAMGPMAGLIQTQFTQMVEQLTQAVREVHLTVTWKNGKVTESIDLVTHVVSLGPGSDRNGNPAAAAAAAAAGAPGAPGAPQQVAPGTLPNGSINLPFNGFPGGSRLPKRGGF